MSVYAQQGHQKSQEGLETSTPKAISDLAVRRARHRLLSGESGDKRTPRPANKVIKSASATALSLLIPSGEGSPGSGASPSILPPCVYGPMTGGMLVCVGVGVCPCVCSCVHVAVCVSLDYKGL